MNAAPGARAAGGPSKPRATSGDCDCGEFSSLAHLANPSATWVC